MNKMVLMARRTCLPCSWIFMTWLLLCVILGSQNLAGQLDNKANDAYVSSSVVVKTLPSRKACRSRKYNSVTRVPPSWKSLACLKLGNMTIFATCMVLLAGDIEMNPGPVRLSNNGLRIVH